MVSSKKSFKQTDLELVCLGIKEELERLFIDELLIVLLLTIPFEKIFITVMIYICLFLFISCLNFLLKNKNKNIFIIYFFYSLIILITML